MSTPLVVATILVTGWNLVLTIAAFLTETGPFQSGVRADREMAQSLMQVQAEVGTPDLDARTNAWKRSGSINTTEYVESRVTDASQEVTVTAPYAEASVTVASDEGEVPRRCSVCLN